MHFSFSEMLLIVLVAVVVLGPKQLPQAMRYMGRGLGRLQKFLKHTQNKWTELEIPQSQKNEDKNK